MAKIIGVRFRNVGKVYYFNPGDLQMKIGDHVIVETSRGLEYGKVVLDPREVEEEKVVIPHTNEQATTNLGSLFANIKL